MRVSIAKVLASVVLLAGLSVAGEPSSVWLDVPFVKQQKNGCGAASLSMVMKYWIREKGEASSGPAEAQNIQQALDSREEGIAARDMERYLREHGFHTFVFQGEWADLKEQLSQGRPLIVCLMRSGRNASRHYLVVAGLDWQQDLVLVNDPAQRKLLKLDLKSLEKDWEAADRWTLLALPRQTG